MNKKILSALLFVTTICIANVSLAYDAELAESSKCSRYFSMYEEANHMPSNLIRAVSVTESGKYIKSAGRPQAWPWTVNAAGKGYYFANKREAIRAVNEFRAQGIKSIDVGCMQINLKHHPEAFRNLEQAFEPKYNIAYAAKFLMDNYTKARSWKEAIGLYHNGISELNRDYIAQVYSAWRIEDGKSTQIAFLEKPRVGAATASRFGENVDVDSVAKNVMSTFDR